MRVARDANRLYIKRHRVVAMVIARGNLAAIYANARRWIGKKPKLNSFFRRCGDMGAPFGLGNCSHWMYAASGTALSSGLGERSAACDIFQKNLTAILAQKHG